jgi:hypothetical protein
MPLRGIRSVLLGLAGVLLVASLAARAQSPAPQASDDDALAKALLLDPASVAGAPERHLRLPGYADGAAFAIVPDGTSGVTVKTPLPVVTKAGADLAPPSPTTYSPEQPLPGSKRNSGAAWASLGVPNVGSIEARVDPNNDQGKLGATLERVVPIGSALSVTLEEQLSLTDSLGCACASPSGSPFLAATPPVTAAPSQDWGNENKAKFDILPTGTSLAAGLSTSSDDSAMHYSLSADQKIYGPLHVTTALNDVGQPTASKSISAGLKLNW